MSMELQEGDTDRVSLKLEAHGALYRNLLHVSVTGQGIEPVK